MHPQPLVPRPFLLDPSMPRPGNEVNTCTHAVLCFNACIPVLLDHSGEDEAEDDDDEEEDMNGSAQKQPRTE